MIVAGDKYPAGKKLPVDKAPIIIDDNIENIVNDLLPVKDKPLNFTFHNVKMMNADGCNTSAILSNS